MGSKASTEARARTFSASNAQTPPPNNNTNGGSGGLRARSFSSSGVPSSSVSAGPSSSGILEFNGRISSFSAGSSSHPSAAFWPITGVKCPICSKTVMPDDIEVHLVMCLTRPRISYNEDVLDEASWKGESMECVICLEELEVGHVIARLPCLCIYHKHCIDQWFQVNRSCPEHPNN